jgi:hypothetical protein
LLEQQSLITVYCSPTKENSRSFSVSVGSKPTKACRLRLPFDENKWNLSFIISSVFRLLNSRNVETWRHEAWAWRQQTENASPGDFRFPFAEKKTLVLFSLVLFFVCGIPDTWRHRDIIRKTAQEIFVIRLQFVIRPFVDEEKKEVIRLQRRTKKTKKTDPTDLPTYIVKYPPPCTTPLLNLRQGR